MVESWTDFEYWSRCHLGRVLHADGTVTRYDYDCNGNLDRLWDANHPFVDEGRRRRPSATSTTRSTA